jgi:UDP-N-acetylglucosamine acyltransferase
MAKNDVHPGAFVSEGALLAEDVKVAPLAVIEEGTRIGRGTEIRSHAVIKRFTTLGEGNVIHEGAILGGEPQDLAFTGSPSELRIGDRNTFRENVTVHRSTKAGGATVVGSDNMLMSNAHVAHDCRLGDRVILASNVILAGHVEIGDAAFLSGNVGVHQFSRIGRLAMVGGLSKVVQDCLPFVTVDGAPARSRSLNLVGLRRAGVRPEQLRTLKQAFRLLLRSSLPLEAALTALQDLRDPLVDELVSFVRASKRGFCHAYRKGAEEE